VDLVVGGSSPLTHPGDLHRIRGFVACIAHTALFRLVAPLPARRIRRFVASHGAFFRFLPFSPRRIPGFVARAAHTAHFCRILPLSARRISEFVARRMPFCRFLPEPARRIPGFVAQEMPFFGFLPFQRDESVDSSAPPGNFPSFAQSARRPLGSVARRIAWHDKRCSCDTNRVCDPGLEDLVVGGSSPLTHPVHPHVTR
jgi:hypothetical protein